MMSYKLICKSSEMIKNVEGLKSLFHGTCFKLSKSRFYMVFEMYAEYCFRIRILN